MKRYTLPPIRAAPLNDSPPLTIIDKQNNAERKKRQILKHRISVRCFFVGNLILTV